MLGQWGGCRALPWEGGAEGLSSGQAAGAVGACRALQWGSGDELYAEPVTPPKCKTLGCADIGACESIMKKKTKQDFQEMIKAEHCEHGSVSVITPWLPRPQCPTSGLSHSLGVPGCPCSCWGGC